MPLGTPNGQKLQPDKIEAKGFIAQSLIIIGADLQLIGASDKETDYLERALKISEEKFDLIF